MRGRGRNLSVSAMTSLAVHKVFNQVCWLRRGEPRSSLNKEVLSWHFGQDAQGQSHLSREGSSGCRSLWIPRGKGHRGLLFLTAACPITAKDSLQPSLLGLERSLFIVPHISFLGGTAHDGEGGPSARSPKILPTAAWCLLAPFLAPASIFKKWVGPLPNRASDSPLEIWLVVKIKIMLFQHKLPECLFYYLFPLSQYIFKNKK